MKIRKKMWMMDRLINVWNNHKKAILSIYIIWNTGKNIYELTLLRLIQNKHINHRQMIYIASRVEKKNREIKINKFSSTQSILGYLAPLHPLSDTATEGVHGGRVILLRRIYYYRRWLTKEKIKIAVHCFWNSDKSEKRVRIERQGEQQIFSDTKEIIEFVKNINVIILKFSLNGKKREKKEGKWW